MPFELKILVWGCLLGLVHIFAAGHVRTRQYGAAWNMSARDEAMPPPKPMVGRLLRAQANYFETFPIVAALLLFDGLGGLGTRWTAIGAGLWLGARIVYLPLYAFGVPIVRTLVWTVGFAGLLLLLWPPLLLAL